MNDLYRHIRVISLPVAIIWLVSCTGQNDSRPVTQNNTGTHAENASGQAVISFDTMTHDFGTIIEGEMVVCYFGYENRGTDELVINTVEATCGCTIPDWNREPLIPGERDRLKVVFDASGRSGMQRKSVTVRSNAENSTVRLTISAKIQS